VTGSLADWGARMSDPSPERERAAKLRQSRQVIAGPDIEPPAEPLPYHRSDSPFAQPLLWYFLALSALMVLTAVLWAIWGLAAATAPWLLLVIGLFLAWFIL
jgi:hypothetical protein